MGNGFAWLRQLTILPTLSPECHASSGKRLPTNTFPCMPHALFSMLLEAGATEMSYLNDLGIVPLQSPKHPEHEVRHYGSCGAYT